MFDFVIVQSVELKEMPYLRQFFLIKYTLCQIKCLNCASNNAKIIIL